MPGFILSSHQGGFTINEMHNQKSDIPKIIAFLERTSLKNNWDANISDGAGDDGIRIPAKYVRGFIETLRSRSAQAPEQKIEKIRRIMITYAGDSLNGKCPLQFMPATGNECKDDGTYCLVCLFDKAVESLRVQPEEQ